MRIEDAAAAGRTIVCCNWPPLDGHVDGWVLVFGWAHSPSGIHEVVISVDGVRQGAAVQPMARPDVKFTYGIESAEGFLARLDGGAWGEGEHAITIAALARDGAVARASGVLTVSRHGPYRSWLESNAGRSPRRRRGGEPSTVDGRDLSGELSSLASRGRGHLLLVEQGGQPAPGAAALVAAALDGSGGADLVYGDEDAVVEDGGRGADFLKPGWSPELLLSTDYVGPLLGVGPRAARAALESGEGPVATIYELCLRLVDAPLRVARIPEVLFTSEGRREPSDDRRVREAIEAVGRRRGLVPRFSSPGVPGARRVGWEIRGEPRVSVIVPTAAAHDQVGRCLASLVERTSWPNLELVLVDSSDGGLAPHLRSLEGVDHSVVPYEGGFNFSAICNLGAARASGDYLLLLNDDTEVRAPDWIERMLEHAQVDGVGVVGAKLLFPDGDVQHGGVSINRGANGAAHMFAHLPGADPGYNGLLCLTRNVSAVTAACMMVPAPLFDSLGGFDEDLAADLGDTDFCLRTVAAGRRVVQAPAAELLHHQQSSRPVSGDPGDLERFRARWQGSYGEADPLYHPGFADFPSYEYLTPLPESNIAASEPPGNPQTTDAEHYAEERYTPGAAGRGRLIEAEHQARYRWAAQVAAGREVLDAGCGTGYGTAILARAGAKRAVGVDASEQTIAEAAERAGGAEFVVGDLQQLPFEDSSFDLVACFEAIEHVPDHRRALDELRRVVRDDGLLLVSSPNRRVFPPGNHWHVHEFFPEELEEALAARFRNVRLHRQQANLASSISSDEEFTTDDPEVELEAGPRRVAAGTPGSELYTVAAASDAPLPEMSAALVMTDSFDIGGVLAHAIAMDRHARDLERQRDAILASPSWRVTAPLRALKRLVTRRSPE